MVVRKWRSKNECLFLLSELISRNLATVTSSSAHGGHVESEENKKLCFCTASLALISYLAEACRAKTKLFIGVLATITGI